MLFYVTIKYNDLLKNKFIQRQIESSRYFKVYPVGVIFAVSADRKNIKFINLQDLTFTSKTDTHNFNPQNPYENTEPKTTWGKINPSASDFTSAQIVAALQKSCSCSCEFE